VKWHCGEQGISLPIGMVAEQFAFVQLSAVADWAEIFMTSKKEFCISFRTFPDGSNATATRGSASAHQRIAQTVLKRGEPGILVLGEIGCGGGASSPGPSASLSGNWQFNIYPNKSTTAQSESGFLLQSKNSVSGNLAVQPTATRNCSGVAPLSGTVSGSNVTLSINEFGSVLSLLGSFSTLGSSNLSSMSGSYTASDNVCAKAIRIRNVQRVDFI